MCSPRHHKGLLLLVTPPPPSSRGVVSTVTCDGIAKEQRGDIFDIPNREIALLQQYSALM